MREMLPRLIGTISTLLLVSAFIGGNNFVTKLIEKGKKKRYAVIIGIVGGLFGIYGNISGFNLNGAVVSVRDIGPMFAGFSSGPVGGLIAGIIAGVHRLTLGGSSAYACVVATCIIGLISGIVSHKCFTLLKNPYFAWGFAACMETMHLGIVLIMVKPFEEALSLVETIALPFILVNSAGFALMMVIISYIEKQRNLVIEKSRLQSELEVATVIQQSLLPTITQTYPGRKEVDVSAFMQAAKEVGGDFYDIFFVDSQRIAFLIGDVSGKGVPAALFMATSKTILQNCIRDIPSLSKAVETANNALCARNEADMFVTVWVGVLDLKTGEMTYTSAGHNPPVIVKDGIPEYLKTKCGFVLAGMNDIKYKENTLQLKKGDIVYLYTDGVTEANDFDENLYGEERLLKCFDGLNNLSADEISDKIKTSVDEFVNGNDQFDDITMLCFKYLGINDDVTTESST